MIWPKEWPRPSKKQKQDEMTGWDEGDLRRSRNTRKMRGSFDALCSQRGMPGETRHHAGFSNAQRNLKLRKSAKAQGQRNNHKVIWTTSSKRDRCPTSTTVLCISPSLNKGAMNISDRLGTLGKSLSSQKVARQVKKGGRSVLVPSLLDLCHLEPPSLRNISKNTRESRAPGEQRQ